MSKSKPFRKDPEKRDALRLRLFNKQKGRCHLCGEPMQLARRGDASVNRLFATFDHLTPVSHGGKSAKSNIRLAHRACNNARGSAPIQREGITPPQEPVR